MTSPAMRLAAFAAASTLTACGGGGSEPNLNTIPAGVTQHSVTSYTATSVGSGSTAATQDLLTAGLGKSGLVNTAATPTYADPLNPTVAELRRNALLANYRAILDPSVKGGFGTLYGPNIDLTGGDTLGEGLIPGKEYLASIEQGSASAPAKVVIAVQIPSSFDVNNPCIVAGPSSGSRGVYGAIATASEWGLKRGCAVALTDGGKGAALYDPMDDTVNKVDGTRATRASAGALAEFAAGITDAARATFNALFPNRLALKQVHSQVNPEKDWGNDTLTSIAYALYALNEEYGGPDNTGVGKATRFNAANTLIIAGSVSNGGAAVLQAGEKDDAGLIDGIVAGEPSAQPNTTSGYGVMYAGSPVSSYGKSIIDYFTIGNLYQPCAALAPSVVLAESSIYNYMTLTGMNGRAANRCAALAAQGLLPGITAANTTAEQANEALNQLHLAGFTTFNDTMHNHLYGLGNSAIIGAMYTTGYGRFALDANICGTSFAQVNATGDVVAVTPATKAAIAAIGNGTANGSPASVVYNESVGGAKAWNLGVSPTSGTADFSLDAAVCERALVTGKDPRTGAALTASTKPTLAQSQAVQAGIGEVLLNGNLHGKPTLIVAGRSDGLVAINHSERSYLAFNKVVEGASSQLRYVEVENAQHFDTFLPFSGFDTRFVPLHVYFNRAMNAMYAKLKNGTALPESQVVRTLPRGGTAGAAPQITPANVPPFVATPASGNAITFTGTSANIPL